MKLSPLSFFLSLLFLIPSSKSLAETLTEQIGPFGNLNNRDNSMAIPSNQSQDQLNIDVSPGGRSIKKRAGYGTAFTLSQTTSAVHGVYFFYNVSGNDVALFFNDTKMTASVSGGAATVVM